MWSGISDGSYKFTFTEPFATTPNITYTLKWDNGSHHNVYILSKVKQVSLFMVNISVREVHIVDLELIGLQQFPKR